MQIKALNEDKQTTTQATIVELSKIVLKVNTPIFALHFIWLT